MTDTLRHFIDGAWVASVGGSTRAVIDPVTEQACGETLIGTATDVDRAVAAARDAFPAFAATDLPGRRALIERVVREYRRRLDEMGRSIAQEMGAPLALAIDGQAGAGIAHLEHAIDLLDRYPQPERTGASLIIHEPIGVVGMITPWNWPMNQIGAKLGLCLAAGNTIVLKPSEECPTCAMILAEIMAAAGVPAGVFNLVLGDGPETGAALAAHPLVDMISFTGSTRAGVAVAQAAAPSVKRVHQELGGKAANIVLPDVDLAAAMPDILIGIVMNAGQSCTAPTRILVPAARADEAARLAAAHMRTLVWGVDIGPVVNHAQWRRNQELIEWAMAEGAIVAAGGTGLPPGIDRGFYVRPTVLAGVTPAMTIWREESFGPIATITSYRDLDEAVRLANDTDYGLSAVVTGDIAIGRQLAPRLRAGGVCLTGWTPPVDVPFGGYGRSGNGREGGLAGLRDFMEVKAIVGG